MTENTKLTKRWGQERRLEFIDFRLQWEGRVNRSDITEVFRISIPQASLDLAHYQSLAPHNLEYDRVQKTYVATECFEPVLVSTNPYEYLNELMWQQSNGLSANDGFIGWSPPFDTLPNPYRLTNTEHLKDILKALRNKLSIEITYQSMNNPEPHSRRIMPRVFAFDGFRWHVRSYCFERGEFRDFVLGRIFSVRNPMELEPGIPNDEDWERFVAVVLAPNPMLSPQQKLLIERDYQMEGGKVELTVRKSMLNYLLRRLNLQGSQVTPDESQQIVLREIREN